MYWVRWIEGVYVVLDWIVLSNWYDDILGENK